MSLQDLGRYLAAATLVAASVCAQDRLPLRVLYAGDGDTTRADEFVAFLRERTASVRNAARETLSSQDLTEIDVVVIDGDPDAYTQGRGDKPPPRPPRFDLLTGMPTVLVGWVGLTTGSYWQLKTSLFLG